jgi:VWFA-related protein
MLALVLGLGPWAFSQQDNSGAAPEAGGPQGTTGPYALPKKADQAPEHQPVPQRPQPVAGVAAPLLHADTTLVNLDISVLTKDGYPIPGLRQEHFRVLEDGVPQTINSFGRTEAPMTAVLLVEFANINANFVRDALRASYVFADSMRKGDNIAVITFDMRTDILQDFTTDKESVYKALNSLRMPGFRETNLYDALYETLDRVDRIPGRKEILVVTRGIDTFSRMNYDKLMKKVKETPNVTIYAVGTGRVYMELLDARYGSSMGMRINQLDYQMGENLLRNITKATGGQCYFPRFAGELDGIMKDVTQAVRNQYTLTYRPTNAKLDGTFRKLQVQLIKPGTTTPLIIQDQKGKQLKYELIYRDGYRAHHEVE